MDAPAPGRLDGPRPARAPSDRAAGTTSGRKLTGRLTPAGHIAWQAGNDAAATEPRPGSPRADFTDIEPAGRVRRTPHYLFRPALARAARGRMLRRRRRTVMLAVLLAAAGLVVADLVRGDGPPSPEQAATPVATAGAPAGTRPTRAPARGAAKARPRASVPSNALPPARRSQPASPELDFPIDGPGTWTYATGTGSVLGRAGTLRRFRVAVEDGAGQDAAAFTSAIERIFGDPRGWAASGQLRWQRVPRETSAEFTIFLATPGTSERVCATGGLNTERFTNCRLPGKVVINLARWRQAVPEWNAPLAEYQAYAINHEVGHQLGRGHEGCPAPGRAAPVMQQQTLGLRGCTAYGWPYLDGRRYAGPPVP